jgi:G3E family GTPase
MTELSRIPINLVTGFLGVGKTTAIRHLIQQKRADERWAVLVNEFGEVGIDGAILESTAGEGVAVTEIAGGCFCCSTDAPIDFTLVELIRQISPHRILVEPTGLGHPARTLDTLKSPWLRSILDLRATICLADSSDYANPQITNEKVFLDQLHMADVVVINKIDRSAPAGVDKFRQYLAELFPAKSLILTTTDGAIDRSILDADISPERVPLFPDAHSEGSHANSTLGTQEPTTAVSLLLPRHPIRKENRQSDRAACGWIFSPLDSFRKVDLFELLGGSFEVHRLKGVFNVGNEWLYFNRVGGDLTCESIPYRRDSRLEVILDQPEYDWDDFERLLLNCLKSSPAQ